MVPAVLRPRCVCGCVLWCSSVPWVGTAANLSASDPTLIPAVACVLHLEMDSW